MLLDFEKERDWYFQAFYIANASVTQITADINKKQKFLIKNKGYLYIRQWRSGKN